MGWVIDLTGKTALITGAARGIGAEIARHLHIAGASVLLNHPDPDDGPMAAAARQLADELNRGRPGSARVEPANVADAGEVQAMMERIADHPGHLEILVNNAGILRDRSLARMTLDDWHAVLNVNLTGVFHVCKFALPLISDGGVVINLGSIAADAGFHGQANYAAAKAGVHALTRVLARECARRAIRVNAVAPGVVETSMMEQIAPEVRQRMLQQIPLGRFARPDEVARVVLFLASDLASYMTGSILEVNGGWRG
ncbi:MAG: beta-ketoacyl-ACP reductase [Isosphaeraceae bacterium]|jgi:3-oxoacyl-[acyl-carrier protein] reductase|nr:MAG: beta-ketoacyl-ACP reductase [Isosphaeraceae bacterium]